MLKSLLLAGVLLASCGAALPVQSTKEGAPAQAGAAGTPSESPAPKAPAGARASKTIDAAQLLEDVRTLSADAMEGRGAGTKGGAAARAYVERRFKEAGLEPFWPSYEQAFDLPAGAGGAARRGVNVVGYVRGTSKAGRLVFVTAHYDHLGVRGGQVYNGADDNASGVAALLQMAAHFARQRPRNPLVFAALDAEEEGLLGASALVSRLRAEQRQVALDVNLDMVGHSERGELYAAGAYQTPGLRPLLERVAARAPVRLLLGHDRPEQGHDDWTNQSDHYAFHKAGVPFVYFGVEDHKDYHQPTDDFQTLTPDFFVGAAETLLDVLQTLDAELFSVVGARPSLTASGGGGRGA